MARWRELGTLRGRYHQLRAPIRALGATPHVAELLELVDEAPDDLLVASQ